MCYLVVERYSVCRCLYYKHSVDMCAAYGTQGHPIHERTVLVASTCEEHSGLGNGTSDTGYTGSTSSSSNLSGRNSRERRRTNRVSAPSSTNSNSYAATTSSTRGKRYRTAPTSARSVNEFLDLKEDRQQLGTLESNLLNELRGLTPNYPFVSEALDAATSLVENDPKSNQSRNHVWLVLVRLRDDSIIQAFATIYAAKPEMWGGRRPDAEEAKQLGDCFADEWNKAVEKVLSNTHPEAANPQRSAAPSTRGEETNQTSDSNGNKDQPAIDRMAIAHSGGYIEVADSSTKSSNSLVENGELERPEVLDSESNDDPQDESLLAKLNSAPSTQLDVLRARLLSPRHYLYSLKQLEIEICENSSIHIYGSENPHAHFQLDGSDAFITYPEGFRTSDLSNIRYGHLTDEYINSILPPTWALNFLHTIRVCRNIAHRTCFNLQRLRQADFCSASFSFLVVEESRPDVAKLETINITDFELLVRATELVLKEYASMVSDISNSPISKVEMENRLKDDPNMNLIMDWSSRFFPTPQDLNKLDPASSLQLLVQMLDLAVVSYAGAHLSNFAEEYLRRRSRIDLVSSFSGDRSLISFQPCYLQCLDLFHHSKPVWAFTSSQWKFPGPLYVSAKMGTFADIWGPLWKEKDPTDSTKYTSYIVGNGVIFKWSQDLAKPPLRADEVFCHWVSDAELEDDEFDTSEILGTTFSGIETLLIGAPTTGRQVQVLSPNPRCKFAISKARQYLKDVGRLRVLGTVRPYRFNDGTEYQLQVGYSGMNAAATKQYKRVPGQPLKDVLVELWAMEPDMRDPQLLEDLYGLEVSLCTHNSQRVSLSQLLGLECMRSYLRNFNWDDKEYESEYFSRLRNGVSKLSRADGGFRKNFEKAVMLCLNVLKKTGLDRKENLQVFLSSFCTPKPELATLISKEHSWVRLLQDTTTDCTMAAFGDTCLEFKHVLGVTCGGIGKSVLRTAIVPNEIGTPVQMRLKRFKRTELSEVWVHRWDVSLLKIGSTLWLGERGKLCLIAHLADDALLMEWRSPALTTAVKSLITRAQPHREFSEIDHRGQQLTRPVPVFVMSHQIGEG